MNVRTTVTAPRAGHNSRRTRAARMIFNRGPRVTLALDLVNDDQVLLDCSRREAKQLADGLYRELLQPRTTAMSEVMMVARIGDQALLRVKGDKWRKGEVTATYAHATDGYLSVQTSEGLVQALHPEKCFDGDSPDRLLVFPPEKELKREDPRGRLRRFARKHQLMIVRAPWPHVAANPQYLLVDPAADYQPLRLRRTVEETTLLRFNGRSFNHLTWSRHDLQVMLMRPAGRGRVEKVIEYPPGFEPRMDL